MKVKRFPNNPIIRPHMDDRMGDNINGPSLIKVPDWLPSPLGKYYLYFAHHKGKYIRLAYADSLEGPWKIYSPGVLDLKDSFFKDHIASPDIHIDHQNKQLWMYYHGSNGVPPQQTRIAFSKDGVHFEANEPILGTFYFRVFQWKGYHYAISSPDKLWRSSDGIKPFEQIGNIGLPVARHSALKFEGSTLRIFYTQWYDCPESIFVASMDLNDDPKNWKAVSQQKILEPEFDWEGVNAPREPSKPGPIWPPAYQLRDPGIYQENGKTYLLYGVAGEQGLAIAEVFDS
jgi:hypothetical protein